MKRLDRIIWGVLLLAVGAVVAAALFAQSRKVPLPIIGHWEAFGLTNQLGQRMGPESFRGQVVIANIIFSRCPTQCHQLSLRMSRLQSQLSDGVHLVSLTADPTYDTPEVLSQYGKRYGTDATRWSFLTGPKAEVYHVAEKDLLFSVMDTGELNPKLEDRFIHSGNFVVIDRQGRLRAVVQNETPDVEERLLAIARQLSRETRL